MPEQTVKTAIKLKNQGAAAARSRENFSTTDLNKRDRIKINSTEEILEMNLRFLTQQKKHQGLDHMAFGRFLAEYKDLIEVLLFFQGNEQYLFPEHHRILPAAPLLQDNCHIPSEMEIKYQPEEVEYNGFVIVPKKGASMDECYVLKKVIEEGFYRHSKMDFNLQMLTLQENSNKVSLKYYNKELDLLSRNDNYNNTDIHRMRNLESLFIYVMQRWNVTLDLNLFFLASFRTSRIGKTKEYPVRF